MDATTKLPLTGKQVAHTIITEKAIFEVTKDGLVLTEIHPDVTVEDLKKVTEPDFKVSKTLKKFSLN